MRHWITSFLLLMDGPNIKPFFRFERGFAGLVYPEQTPGGRSGG